MKLSIGYRLELTKALAVALAKRSRRSRRGAVHASGGRRRRGLYYDARMEMLPWR